MGCSTVAKLRKLPVKLADALRSLKGGRKGKSGVEDEGVKFPVYRRMTVASSVPTFDDGELVVGDGEEGEVV
ncbi:hypothetical protein L6452_27841 [Arctium lappa]|uniref:Uncharacterized protein n=1 Tax=Arctium lappa TaxID=4217 RepID=A0ACB8ZWT8_ARCLA|nr:hypothetical protein L6452_27841 [Arctium lappa]